MRQARRPLVLLLLSLAVAVLVVDQLTKIWAVRTLSEGVRTDVLGDLLGLTLLYNPGAALSLGGTGMTWVLTLAALTVSVVILRVAGRLGSRAWAVALGLLLGGALGNLVDRVVREPGIGRGHVVDFIAYWNLFVGNVADIAIVGAAGLIIVLSLRGIGIDGRRTPAQGPHETSDGTSAADGARSVDDLPASDGASADHGVSSADETSPADAPTSERPAPRAGEA